MLSNIKHFRIFNYGFPHSYNKIKKDLDQNISIFLQTHHTLTPNTHVCPHNQFT